MKTAQLLEQILKLHTEYNDKVCSLIAPLDEAKGVTYIEKIDRLVLHVIEEIVEMRRTYPHKFWKRSPEVFNKQEMLEEAADIFLMSHSMFLEVCNACGITEEEFFEKILEKTKINHERIDNGY